MSPPQPVYSQPMSYDYFPQKPHVNHIQRKHSDGAVLHGHHMGMQKSNTDFKTNTFAKKGNGRKRVFSTIEPHAMFDNKFGRFSGN